MHAHIHTHTKYTPSHKHQITSAFCQNHIWIYHMWNRHVNAVASTIIFGKCVYCMWKESKRMREWSQTNYSNSSSLIFNSMEIEIRFWKFEDFLCGLNSLRLLSWLLFWTRELLFFFVSQHDWLRYYGAKYCVWWKFWNHLSAHLIQTLLESLRSWKMLCTVINSVIGRIVMIFKSRASVQYMTIWMDQPFIISRFWTRLLKLISKLEISKWNE